MEGNINEQVLFELLAGVQQMMTSNGITRAMPPMHGMSLQEWESVLFELEAEYMSELQTLQAVIMIMRDIPFRVPISLNMENIETPWNLYIVTPLVGGAV